MYQKLVLRDHNEQVNDGLEDIIQTGIPVQVEHAWKRSKFEKKKTKTLPKGIYCPTRALLIAKKIMPMFL